MRAWLDLLALGVASPSGELATPVFRALTRPTAPGACGKCHRIEQRHSGSVVVQWQPTRSGTQPPRSTAFTHVTHFSQAGADLCADCHRLQASAEQAETGTEPLSSPGSSFAPISKELCAACHTGQLAGDACTLCHPYHRGTTSHQALSTPISELVARR
jgi:hypothetical protein